MKPQAGMIEPGIEVGDGVDMEKKSEEARISTRRDRIRQIQERARQYAKPGTLVSEELSAERREAARHERENQTPRA